MTKYDENPKPEKEHVPCSELKRLKQEFGDFKENSKETNKRIENSLKEIKTGNKEIMDLLTNTQVTNGVQNERIDKIVELEKKVESQATDITGLKSKYAKLSVVFILVNALFISFLTLVTYGLILR